MKKKKLLKITEISTLLKSAQFSNYQRYRFQILKPYKFVKPSENLGKKINGKQIYETLTNAILGRPLTNALYEPG